MTYVKARENDSFDQVFRRFKKFCEKSGVLADLKSKEFYERPGVRRKKKQEAAMKRLHKNKKGPKG